MLFLFSIMWGSVSVWWLLACLALGLLYAWYFYRQQPHMSLRSRYLLGVLRFMAASLIALLLLSPLLKTVKRNAQKPLVLIAQDNSLSISIFRPAGFEPIQFVKQLGELKTALGEDYDVREFNFSKIVKDSLSTSFEGRQTNLSNVFTGLNNRFANQNIGAIVLASDGIFNNGSSPKYLAQNMKTSIYTIALGDTIPKQDLLISNISYNKTAFLGNNFAVNVLVEAYQSNGISMMLTVKEDGHSISTQLIKVSTSSFRRVVPITISADKKGRHKFTFSLQPIAHEVSTDNNTETIYIEVLDSRQKICILYDGAHPDITAIKATLESNRNYEVKTVQVQQLQLSMLASCSLVILYQLPTNGSLLPSSLLEHLSKSKVPLWYFLGAQSDVAAFNRLQNILQISSSRQDLQDVFAVAKTDFSAFTLSDSTRNQLNIFPPLLASSGNYTAASSQTVLLNQRIGSVATTYPLLAFGEANGTRIAVMAAEGIWKWRLSDFSSRGNYNALEELLGQSVQYLTTKGDRSRFRVYPSKNVFDESDDVLLNGELYNESLELVNTPELKIDLKGKLGKIFSFMFTRNGKGYQLNAGILPADEYTYLATTKLADKDFTVNGELIVKPINSETRQSAADHRLLFTLAKQSGGQMVMPSQTNQLAEMIRKNENIKTVIYNEESYGDFVDQKWTFALVLLLLSMEWFLRKREGEV